MISLLLCVWSVDMYGMCCVQCRISVDRRTQLPHLLPAVYCCRCCRISRLPSRYENRGNVCSIVSACLSYKYLSGCVIKRYALSVNFSCTDNTFAAGNPEQFCYLNQGMSPVVQSIDDAEDFVSVRQALTLLGELELLTPYAPRCIVVLYGSDSVPVRYVSDWIVVLLTVLQVIQCVPSHGKLWKMIILSYGILYLFTQIINDSVKPMIHSPLNRRQLATTFNKQAIFCCRFSADRLWSCVILVMEKWWKISVEKDGTPGNSLLSLLWVVCVHSSSEARFLER